jgi:ribonucleoside-diphosphate reductase alpha chain
MAKTNYLDLEIDLSRDELFDVLGMQRLRESYMRDDEESPQHRFAFVSKKFSSNIEHAQRLYEYSSKHWLSYSTPILSFGRTPRGMPISCFLNYIDDSSAGLVNNLSETNWLSMLGGGVGIGFGIRAADDKSTGVLPHLKTYDASSLAYRQGKTRRGSYAAYLDISHPDIIPFLEMRKGTGDQNQRCLNMHHGINISDRFMELIERSMIDSTTDDGWNLIDPFSGEVRETVSARALWTKILELRMETGEPYIHYIDTSNRALPQFQKDLGLKIHQSNLCSEIILATNEERTAVCCLSSLNMEHYDAWSKDPKFIKDVAEMLDNVLEYFINNAPAEVARAIYSAKQERSIGVGGLGFHAYLQRKGIAFEGVMAKSANNRMFKLIEGKLDEANLELGTERGEAPDAKGTGKRFSHVMAIAPNASSSIIMGNTSPSIEPYRANAYRQDTLSGSHLNKNRYLDELIKKKVTEEDNKLDYDEVWSSIIANDGSVQHLKWMDDIDKNVFKTAMEIDQRWIIEHAADRQNYIDQSQSLNLFFRPDVNVKYLHAIHFMAWKQGLKTLYYCRSEKLGKADKVSKRVERDVIKEIDFQAIIDDNTCIACEG